MASRNRTVLSIAGIVLAVVSLAGAAIAVSVAGQGMIEIEVREEGGADIKFAVPASFVLVALPFLPSEAFEELPAEAVRKMGVLRAIGDDLADTPDFTVVEAESARERVLVRKAGRRLVVEVRDGGDFVHVSVPLAVVDKVAKRIEKGLGGDGRRAIPTRS